MRWVALLVMLTGCTAAQRNWRQNTYVDFSLGGGMSEIKDTTASSGINYPLIGEIWGTAGLWSDFYGVWGTYWGVSYSWAPFAKDKP